MQKLPDLKYGNESPRQALDLYLPEGKTKAAIIIAHGGGWMHGSKADYALTAKYYAGKGYAVASISYRLAPDDKYPAAVEDARCALAWMQEHAQEYGFDARKIFLYGHSAGANLITLVALAEKGEYKGKCVADLKFPPAGVILIAAAYNYSLLPRDIYYIIDSFIGLPGEYRQEDFDASQPINRVKKTAVRFLLFDGEKDLLINTPNAKERQGEEFARLMREKGAFVEQHTMPGLNHSTVVGSYETAKLVEKFLASRLSET